MDVQPSPDVEEQPVKKAPFQPLEEVATPSSAIPFLYIVGELNGFRYSPTPIQTNLKDMVRFSASTPSYALVGTVDNELFATNGSDIKGIEGADVSRVVQVIPNYHIDDGARTRARARDDSQHNAVLTLLDDGSIFGVGPLAVEGCIVQLAAPMRQTGSKWVFFARTDTDRVYRIVPHDGTAELVFERPGLSYISCSRTCILALADGRVFSAPVKPPCAFEGVAGLDDISVAQIACTRTFSVALTTFGELYAWGKLCDNAEVLKRPTRLDTGDTRFTLIAHGDKHAMLTAPAPHLPGCTLVYGLGVGQFGVFPRAERPQLIHGISRAATLHCSETSTLVGQDARVCESVREVLASIAPTRDASSGSGIDLVRPDVVVEAASGEEVGPAHRFMLAARSPALRAALVDGQTDRLRLAECATADAGRQLLHYIYFDTLDAAQPLDPVVQRDLAALARWCGMERLAALAVHRIPPRSQMHEDLCSLVDDKLFADFRIQVEGETVQAHRAVLKARSAYFSAMFDAGMLEASSDTLTVHDFSAEAIGALVRYMYTSEMNLGEERYLELLEAASCYMVADLSALIEEKVVALVDHASVLQLLVFAERVNAEALSEECQRYLTKHFREIMPQALWPSADHRDKINAAKTEEMNQEWAQRQHSEERKAAQGTEAQAEELLAAAAAPEVVEATAALPDAPLATSIAIAEGAAAEGDKPEAPMTEEEAERRILWKALSAGLKSKIVSKIDNNINRSELLDNLPEAVRCVRARENLLDSIVCIRRLLSLEHEPPIDVIIATGVIPDLIENLRRGEPQIQFESAWALTNIASGNHEQTQAVVEAGAVVVFAELLQSSSQEVVDQVIWALGNIAGDSPDYRDIVIATAGTTLTLIHDAVRHRLSTYRNYAWTLSNCCRGKPSPPLATVQPFLGLLTQLLQAGDDEVQTDATWALSYVSDGPNETIQAVIDLGVVPSLVRGLSHHSHLIQIPSLRCIGNIVTGTDAQTQLVLDLGALNHFNSLLASSRNSLRKEACWSLSNITAGTQRQIQSVIDAGLLQPVVNLFSHDTSDIRKEACWVLSNLTSGGSFAQKEYLVNLHVLPHLQQYLDQNPGRGDGVPLEAMKNILQAFSGRGRVEEILEQLDLDALESFEAHDGHSRGMHAEILQFCGVEFEEEDEE